MQFLEGYYEPTLFILYEPIRTWAGRLPVRNDTCKIAAISINITEKANPVIWNMDNLPFDCLKVIAMPKPNGGVLIVAATSLIYLNQSVPSYAASLTSLAELGTSFPMKAQAGIVISLDNSYASLISADQVLFTTKTGDIYVLTMVLDSTRVMKSFHMEKAASSVIPSCICVVCNGIVFLGSHLGNSLLLKYTTKNSADKQTHALTNHADHDLANTSERDSDWIAKDASVLEKELDELEVYGSSEAQGDQTEIQKYVFQVCDSLMNVGPCGRIALGEPAFLSEELAPNCKLDYDLELATTSGYGKNGALSFLQRTVRPQIITTFQLPDICDIWTVKGPLNNDDVTEEMIGSLEKDMHSYLILGKEDSTMVLQTTDDISELDHSGFNTQTATVFAGNIGNDKYTVQVTSKGIRLLLGVKQVHNIPLDIGAPIQSASIGEPYLMVISEQGAMMLLQLKVSDDGDARLTVLKQPNEMECKASTVCLYTDVSGLFTFEKEPISGPAPASRVARVSTSQEETTRQASMLETSTMEDEDELLYGDTSIDINLSLSEPSKPEPTPQPEMLFKAPPKKVVEPTHWALITTKDHKLEIYSIPEFKLAFSANNFSTGYKVLYDTKTTEPVNEGIMKSVPASIPAIKELLVAGLGTKRNQPYIFARTAANNLLVYEAYAFREISDRLQLRFRRFHHNLILRTRQRAARKRQADSDVAPTKYGRQMLKYFDNIGGYTGIFVAGPYPHWFIMSTKGVLRTHPMGIDGRVVCMSSFHNINCPNGFMYFNKQDELRIAILPAHLSYEHQWPLRKVPMKHSCHFIKYHPESKTYLVGMSKQTPCRKLCRIEDDEKKFVEVEKDERFVFTTAENFYVQLFSPINCEPIPGTKCAMEEFEAITAMETLMLRSESSASGLKCYLALSTNNSFNEEVTSKGRLLLYDVIDVVPEPGLPLTKNKLKEIYAKEQKGPVSAVKDVDGMLIAAIGQKIYVFQLKDNDLVGASFIDSQVYIHQMNTIKNLVLIADIHMSISVLRYQSEHRVLSMVSRDIKPKEIYAVEFIVDNTTLGFAATDRQQNVSIYMYQPDAAQSMGGTVLLRKADLNIGASVNSMCRVRCKLNDPSTDKNFPGIIEKKHVTYYATGDGAIGFVLPVTERVYRRLDMTQKILCTAIPHTAGLNPKTFRCVKSVGRHLENAQHNLIDGDLVWKFLSLTIAEQSCVAKRMGTTIDQIMEDLLEIDRVTTHF